LCSSWWHLITCMSIISFIAMSRLLDS
jgi:hypothetical protein